MKFIMALFVVVLHTHPFVDVNAALSFLTTDIFGRAAVPFFFAATGFLLEKQIGQQKEKREILALYIRKVLILYCIWTMVYLPIIIYDKIIISDTPLLYDVLVMVRDFFFVGSYAQLWYLPATAVGLITVYVFRRYAGERGCTIILFILFCMGLLTQSYFGLLLKIVPVDGFLWKLMKLVKMVMVTCRNGVFFGSIFLYMGMYIARCNIRVKSYIAVLGLSLSIALFAVEASCLQKTGTVREQDMYLMLLPTAFFLLLFALSLNVKTDTVFLRQMSINIYFVHMIFRFVYKTFIRKNHDYGLQFFGFTLCGSFIVSYVMYLFGKRSNKEGRRDVS